MSGLPSDLSRRLRNTFMRCGPFGSDRSLRAVFVDARIAPWRDLISDNASSRAARVDVLIEVLLEQAGDAGDPALALFLDVLADRTSPGDACHAELTALAAELRHALAGEATSHTLPPTQALQGGKYEIHIHGGQVGAIGDNAHIEGGINFGKNPIDAPADPEAALNRAQRALAILEEQAAGFGSLEIPVSLKLQLEDKHREVAELARRIHGSHSIPDPETSSTVPGLNTSALPARLDVAVPRKVRLERVFDVAAAIRLPDSSLLDAEGLTKVRSSDAKIVWHEGETRALLKLRVTAPECQIVGPSSHTVFLVKGQDSPVFYFHLMPQQLGDITVIVTLYQKNDTLGNARVRTTVIERVAAEVQVKVSSQPVPIINYSFVVHEGGKLQAGVIGSDAKVKDGVHFESED